MPWEKKSNVKYHSDAAKKISETHNMVKNDYSHANFLGTNMSVDNHQARNRYRALTEEGIEYNGAVHWLNAKPEDIGLRSRNTLNTAKERFEGRQERARREADTSGREWENHKYIDKVQTKNGTVRYIYSDPTQGGRTTLRKPPAESGEKQAIESGGKQTTKTVDRQKAEDRSRERPFKMVEDGVKAVNSLLDLVGDTLASSIDTAVQGLNSLRGLGIQKGTVDSKKIVDHKH